MSTFRRGGARKQDQGRLGVLKTFKPANLSDLWGQSRPDILRVFENDADKLLEWFLLFDFGSGLFRRRSRFLLLLKKRSGVSTQKHDEQD